MNRVVFLDMDGVLCTPRACMAHAQFGLNQYLDPVGVEFLDRFCKAAKANIVVSSSWRQIYDRHSFKALMFAAGFTGTFRKDWKTGYVGHAEYSSKDTRPQEIDEWLEDHHEVDEYVIFDDDEFDWTPKQQKRLILTDTYNGITFQNIVDACNKFQISLDDLTR